MANVETAPEMKCQYRWYSTRVQWHTLHPRYHAVHLKYRKARLPYHPARHGAGGNGITIILRSVRMKRDCRFAAYSELKIADYEGFA